MKVDTLNVNYLIDGKISVIPTNMFYEQLDEEEFQNIRFEVQVNNHQIQSKLSSSIEYAVKYLQKELPDNISIACCQSCRHGNFNPFGDLENEIFCLKDKTFLNRDDVVEIFSKQDKSFGRRSRKLLDFCKSYKPISENEKYTYNDWGLEELS
ncbi:hypothetical protein [Fredinandcohnia sp. 179-A 10B2 NHS]|uniref:hypothetical protein n=1 Tax=unclassified Fredinandcohnia TaxID=2837514 RepID=UPI0039A3AC9C